VKKLIVLVAGLGLMLGAFPGATAGPSAGGYSSDNVEFVQFIPFEVGTATGANFWEQGKDHYMIITSWRSFSIYNINDPENPALESQTPFGFKFENEDVATNGEIMLFSESLPGNSLHIWNVEDVSNPVEIGSVPGAGNHTTSCILDCKWAYGDSGAITDLRNPAKPKLMKEKWGDGMPPHGGNHDVTEVKNGIVLTSTSPMLLLDARKDPVHPKLLAMGEAFDGNGLDFHSNLWPRNMKDRWVLTSGETCCGAEQCTPERSAGWSTWDTKGWQKTKTLKKVDIWHAYQGTVTNGGGVASAPFGCSPHWFTTHPNWNNGGIAAIGWYNSGTRFLEVSSKGKIKEAGWFLPNAGGTSAAYFINKEIVYAVDYQRGLDVLRFTGKA
jgi:hypothetical protein